MKQKSYIVTITETFTRTVHVNAENSFQALRDVRNAYREGNIEFDYTEKAKTNYQVEETKPLPSSCSHCGEHFDQDEMYITESIYCPFCGKVLAPMEDDYLGDTEDITFDGVTYTCRVLESKDREKLIFAPIELEQALIDEKGKYVSEEAREIYRRVFYFVHPETFRLSFPLFYGQMTLDHPEYFEEDNDNYND